MKKRLLYKERIKKKERNGEEMKRKRGKYIPAETYYSGVLFSGDTRPPFDIFTKKAYRYDIVYDAKKIIDLLV